MTMKPSITSRKTALFAGVAGFFALTACSQAPEAQTNVSADVTADVKAETVAMPGKSASDIAFTTIDGAPMTLADFDGKAVLVVNTASKCGYTPQFEGLQALWSENKDKGLVIIGIPSGDFANQEFDDAEDVKSFCKINYGVDFPLMEKSAVTGPDAHAFYKLANEVLGEEAVPKWNFHKVLLDTHGVPVRAFPSGVKPQDAVVVTAIADVLG